MKDKSMAVLGIGTAQALGFPIHSFFLKHPVEQIILLGIQSFPDTYKIMAFIVSPSL
jgi:hypothetical protein